jgi:hypothetical protein
MAILRDIKHTSAEVLGRVAGFLGEYVEDEAKVWINDSCKTSLKGTSRADVQSDVHALGSLLQTEKATIYRVFMSTEQGLLRKMRSDLLGNGHVGLKHKLKEMNGKIGLSSVRGSHTPLGLESWQEGVLQ